MLVLPSVVIAVVALAQGGGPTLFLDLTTPEVKAMDRSKTIGCHTGGGVAATGLPYRPPEPTLRVSIESVNGNAFKFGDVVVAHALLTNTGNEPLLLPWDPDRDVVYGKDCMGLGVPAPPTLEGSLGLKVVDPQGNADFVGGHFLYGRRDAPSTYRVLAPQRSARIRVDGTFYPPPERKGPRAAASNRFMLIGVFDLTDSKLPKAYRTMVSANHLDLALIEK